MSGNATTHSDEEFAKSVLEQTLGVAVERLDGVKAKGDGLVDLEFPVSDGSLAVGEVVSTRQEQTAELGELLSRKGHVVVPGLTRKWIAQVRPDALMKTLTAALPGLLRDLEAPGVHDVSVPRHHDLADTSWQRRLRRLMVQSCIGTLDPTAKLPPGYWTIEDLMLAWDKEGDAALADCEAFLQTVPSKAEKLARRTDAQERHLIVLLTKDEWVLRAYLGISSGETPTRAPDLQPGVDALWLIPLLSPSTMVYWPSGGPWTTRRLEVQGLD